jgi:hypothetical protein
MTPSDLLQVVLWLLGLLVLFVVAWARSVTKRLVALEAKFWALRLLVDRLRLEAYAERKVADTPFLRKLVSLLSVARNEIFIDGVHDRGKGRAL